MKTSYSEHDPRPRVDWGDALTIPNFYGRKEERALLAQWIVQEDCKIHWASKAWEASASQRSQSISYTSWSKGQFRTAAYPRTGTRHNPHAPVRSR